MVKTYLNIRNIKQSNGLEDKNEVKDEHIDMLSDKINIQISTAWNRGGAMTLISDGCEEGYPINHQICQ